MKSPIVYSAIILTLSFGGLNAMYADSAAWTTTASSSDWNTAANWTPMTVPNGPMDNATFDVSTITNVSLSSPVEVNSIVFQPDAGSFTISAGLFDLKISGEGIVNDSSSVERFLVPSDAHGMIELFDAATAGDGVTFTAQGSTGGVGGVINFWDGSSAGDASFILEGGSTGAPTVGGHVAFMGSSTAGNASFVCQGGGDGHFGGTLAYAAFLDNSRAGSSTIIAEGDPDPLQFGLNGVVFFAGQSRAESSTLIANKGKGATGGNIAFTESAKGDKATVKVFANGPIAIGTLEIFLIDGPSLTIGSLEGDGWVILGDKNLTVGSNDADTTFSGSIQNAGSLTKIGSGTFVLASANIYTGGTVVQRGRLMINNSTGSATGTGPVQINRGGLGGKGFIGGSVTIGDSSGPGAELAPSRHGAGLLTLENSLTFKEGSQYKWSIDTQALKADKVIAQGITIEPGALFALVGRGSPLQVGTVFTAISNTSITPIGGAFSNLPDGGTITTGNNNFLASYEGGDGNDLTLTVVP